MRALVRNWLPALKGRGARCVLTRLALCSLVVITLGGCVTAYAVVPIAPTDLSSIQVGATRETVERVLGKPVEKPVSGSPAGPYQYAEYEYSGGKESKPQALLLLPLIEPLFWRKLNRDPEPWFRKHMGKIFVTYGPDDTVLRLRRLRSKFEMSREDPVADEQWRQWEERNERNELQFRAKQEDAAAQNILGQMYYNGEGFPQDYAEAVKWYRKAAEQGYDKAQSNLGLMYKSGQGVTQDYVQAYIWFNFAASSFPPGENRDKAVKDRDDVAKRMTPAQISEAKKLAREWRPKK